jgi:hypothetical protein
MFVVPSSIAGGAEMVTQAGGRQLSADCGFGEEFCSSHYLLRDDLCNFQSN